MKISPTIISFIKALGVVVLVSVLSFLGNEANLTGILNPLIASLIAALASALETNMKVNSGNTKGLFGAVQVSKPSYE